MNLLLSQAAESAAPAASLTSLPWIDKVAAVLLAIFIVLGIFRGLWWQIIRMAGFVGAFAAARIFSPKLEPLLSDTFGIAEPRFAQGLAWFVIFIAGLVVAVLFGRLGNKLLESLKLGLVNRAAGAVAGAATAILIHSAILAVLSLFASGEWLNTELEGSYSADLLEVLAQRWPVIVDEQQGQWIGSQLQGGSSPLVH
jgi:membrane protein required for colicin V production